MHTPTTSFQTQMKHTYPESPFPKGKSPLPLICFSVCCLLCCFEAVFAMYSFLFTGTFLYVLILGSVIQSKGQQGSAKFQNRKLQKSIFLMHPIS